MGLEPTTQPEFKLENLPFRYYCHSLLVCIFAFYKLIGTFVLLNLSLCNTQKPTHNLNLVVRVGLEPTLLTSPLIPIQRGQELLPISPPDYEPIFPSCQPPYLLLASHLKVSRILCSL